MVKSYEVEEEEVVNVVEEEEESVETLETQACCCWPRSAAPEKRAQDVRGTICFWGWAFRGFHVKAEFETALGVVVSRSSLDIFCIKVLILSDFRVSVSRLDMRCFCIKAEF